MVCPAVWQYAARQRHVPRIVSGNHDVLRGAAGLTASDSARPRHDPARLRPTLILTHHYSWPTSITSPSILIVDSSTDAAKAVTHGQQHALSDKAGCRTLRDRSSGHNLPLPGRHTSLSTHTAQPFLEPLAAQVTDILPASTQVHVHATLHVADPRESSRTVVCTQCRQQLSWTCLTDGLSFLHPAFPQPAPCNVPRCLNELHDAASSRRLELKEARHVARVHAE